MRFGMHGFGEAGPAGREGGHSHRKLHASSTSAHQIPRPSGSRCAAPRPTILANTGGGESPGCMPPPSARRPTLIVLDRTGPEPRVLMGKRHDSHKFMPGKFVLSRRAHRTRRPAACSPPACSTTARTPPSPPRRAPPPPAATAPSPYAAISRDLRGGPGVMLGSADYGAPEIEIDGPWRALSSRRGWVSRARHAAIRRPRHHSPPRRPKRFRYPLLRGGSRDGGDAGWGKRKPGFRGGPIRIYSPELVWVPLSQARGLDLRRSPMWCSTSSDIPARGRIRSDDCGCRFYYEKRGAFVREYVLRMALHERCRGGRDEALSSRALVRCTQRLHRGLRSAASRAVGARPQPLGALALPSKWNAWARSGTLIGANTAIAGIAGDHETVPFVPRIAARTGVLPLLWGAVILSALCLVAFKLTYDIVIWFPLRFVFSMALGVLFVLSEYWIQLRAPPGRRGFVNGYLCHRPGARLRCRSGGSGACGNAGLGALFLPGPACASLRRCRCLLARGISPRIDHGTGRTVLSFLLAAPAATVAALDSFGAGWRAAASPSLPLLRAGTWLYGSQCGLSGQIWRLGNVLFRFPNRNLSVMSIAFGACRRFVTIGCSVALAWAVVAHSSDRARPCCS